MPIAPHAKASQAKTTLTSDANRSVSALVALVRVLARASAMRDWRRALPETDRPKAEEQSHET